MENSDDEMVEVQGFRKFHNTRSWVISPGTATAEEIERLGGVPIPCTEEMVPRASLDGGLYNLPLKP